jgi:hypothetical protein
LASCPVARAKARIDDGHGQCGAGEGGHHGDLVAASGFEDEHRGSYRAEVLDERDESRVIVADAKGVAGGTNVDVEMVLGDVDTNETGVFHDPSLRMRAQLAQATVRVR